MIGIILAAGVGSRLRPMTNDRPKCLVKTAGKPILQYQIDSYIKAGITELCIVVGYEAQAVYKYCKHIKGVTIHFVENTVYEDTNNMYSLYLAKQHIYGRDFILNNADLSISPDIIPTLVQSACPDAIAVDTSVYMDESMKIAVDSDGVIGDISKAIDAAESAGCSIDIYKFSAHSGKVLMDEISQIVEVEQNLKDWTEVAMQRLFQAGSLRFYPCDIAGRIWTEIDDYADLASSDRKFSGFDQALASIETFLFDLDGTLYLGEEPIAGAIDTANSLKASGKNVLFLSNNSSRSKRAHMEKLQAMGIQGIDESSIVLSSDGVVTFLQENEVNEVHVLGTKSLQKAFVEAGFRISGSAPEYVVIGYDTELTYQKLVDAFAYINSGVDILATHEDRFCPTMDGPIPDIGALLAMVKATAPVEPKKIFGKPHVEMIAPLLAGNRIDPKTTLVVGDRLHTDIKMAADAECMSLLVLTGETRRGDVDDSANQPDFILSSVADIVQ